MDLITKTPNPVSINEPAAAAPEVRPRVERQPEDRFEPGPNPGLGGAIRRWAGEFWLWYLFWNSWYFPWYTRATKHFFLWNAWQWAPGLRAPTLLNAARILGPGATPAQLRAFGRGVLSNFFDFVEEIGRNLHRTPQEMAAAIKRTEGEEHYRSARALGRGAIIVTAHMGSFEIGAAALRMREPKVHVVFHRDHRPLFESMRARLHQRLGLIEEPVEKGLETWMSVRDALARDEVVILQADRVMPGQAGQRVPFFGGHMLLPTGPIRLAAATGAPLIPVFTLRTAPGSGRFYTVIEAPMVCSQEQIAGEGISEPLRAIARLLERYVRAHGEQWMVLQAAWCEDNIDSGREPQL